MKINIKKNGKSKGYNIIDSWEDVTLDKWAELVAKAKGYKGKADEAIGNISTLSTLPENLIKELTLTDVAALMRKLSDIQSRANSNLKNKIVVDGKTYGYHPNLEAITIGEYADIESCISDGIENNLPEIMAILYRPITEQKDNWYDIEPYDIDSKKIREQIFKTMPAETVESALVFFWIFVSSLLSVLPQFLQDRMRAVTS